MFLDPGHLVGERARIVLVTDNEIEHQWNLCILSIAPPVGHETVHDREYRVAQQALVVDPAGCGEHALQQPADLEGAFDPTPHVEKTPAATTRDVFERQAGKGRQGRDEVIELIERVDNIAGLYTIKCIRFIIYIIDNTPCIRR